MTKGAWKDLLLKNGLLCGHWDKKRGVNTGVPDILISSL